jgi:hypothetical protein
MQGSEKPRSVCSQKTFNHLDLIASPIPDANPIPNTRQTSPFKIHQGELFRFKDQSEDPRNISVKRWIGNFEEHHCFTDEDCMMENCLVKISCITVHDTLIPLADCWTAMGRLGSATTKGAVSDVLLACALVGGICLVIVMKDLSPPVDQFYPISHTTFPDRNKVWEGYCSLVDKALLPLANLGLVHNDIRCAPHRDSRYSIYNILGKWNCREKIDLGLIDYESITLAVSPLGMLRDHEYAVSTNNFPDRFRSAHKILFWQVLWMCFKLSPTEEGNEKSDINTFGFVPNFPVDARLQDFTKLIEPAMPELRRHLNYFQALQKSMADAVLEERPLISEEDVIRSQNVVKEAMAMLHCAFRGDAQDAGS